MNLNNFTIKSQDTIQQAFTIASGYQHQAVETGHVLKALLGADEQITGFILKKLNINQGNFSSVLESIIESYPKVTGGNQYLSSSASKALQKAVDHSKKAGDDFVSVEHLFYGLFSAGDSVSQMMKDIGITANDLEAAITELRKGSKPPVRAQRTALMP
jgi:ATP-dependent Clp protease ATP-binding subunit ClpB